MDRGSFQSTLVMGNLLMRDPWLQPGIDWKCILGKSWVKTQRRISKKPQPTHIFNTFAWKILVFIGHVFIMTFHNNPDSNTSNNKTSWWLNQPIRKICSSNWIISPTKGENNKYLKPPPRRRLELQIGSCLAFPKSSKLPGITSSQIVFFFIAPFFKKYS